MDMQTKRIKMIFDVFNLMKKSNEDESDLLMKSLQSKTYGELVVMRAELMNPSEPKQSSNSDYEDDAHRSFYSENL